MNVSLLPVFNSTESLTSPLFDMLYVFLLPSLFGLTTILKIISITVLSKILKKNRESKSRNMNMFYYIMTYEVCDLIAASQSCLVALYNCGSYCPYAYYYLTNLFAFIFYGFLNNFLIQFQTYNEIAFTIERLQAFQTGQKKSMPFKIKLIIMLVVAAVVTVPNDTFTRSIQPIGILSTTGQLLYAVVNSELVQDIIWAYFFFFYNLLRGFFLYITLLLINIIVIFKYKAYMKRKNTIITPENSNRQLVMGTTKPKKRSKKASTTRLMLAIVTVFLCGNLPFSLNPVVVIFFGANSFIALAYQLLTSFIIIMSHEVYIFVYFFYCNAFRKTFLQIFFGRENGS